MKYFEVFKSRHKAYDVSGGIGIMNNIEKESIAASEMYFTQIAGYKRAKLNFEDDIDIVTESTKTSLEKYIHLRHSAKVSNGDYITYTDNEDRADRTYIIRSVNYDQINPIAHGFFCNQKFKLHGYDKEFLCYSNSTTYGNKGIVDIDTFSLLDSKTKIYVKRTPETESIELGTRIVFNNRYIYRITECDDVVFPGCFIMVAQRDEELVMDDLVNGDAWNDKVDVKEPTKVELSGEDKIKIGKEITITSNEDVNWEIDEVDSVEIVTQEARSITIKGLKQNWIILSAKVGGEVVSTKEIMIYK